MTELRRNHQACTSVGGRPPTAKTADMATRRAVLWLAAILLFSIAVRLLEPTGWLGSDDNGYYSAAEYLLAGEPIERLHHQYGRMVMVIPAAISVALLGHHPAAVILPTFLASIACVALVALLGKRLWSWRVGLMAAAIVGALPYFRTLSTAAYPDVHVCLWSTLALLIATMASRSGRASSNSEWAESGAHHATPLYIFLHRAAPAGCGLAAYLAISAKVLVAPLLLPLVVLVGMGCERWRDRAARLLVMGAGLALGMALEGAFFTLAANDFFYPWRALRSAQGESDNYRRFMDIYNHGPWAFVKDRLLMPGDPGRFGWGMIGVLFWPSLGLAALCDRRARVLAAWAAVAFLSIAFAPVSWSEGYRPFPTFDGRHNLVLSIPFALCLSFVTWFAAKRWLSESAARAGWLAVTVAMVAALVVPRSAVSGFADRDTSRFAAAIRDAIHRGALDGEKPIYLTASAYWRFRILFPEPFRSRLRVAVNDESPDWWRTTCRGILERHTDLPKPGHALLLVTPGQLDGDAEHWDYGVRLPGEALAAWRDHEPLLTYDRRDDRRVLPCDPASCGPSQYVLLVLDGASRPPPANRNRVTQRAD